MTEEANKGPAQGAQGPAGKPEIKPIEPPVEPEHEFLDPGALRIFEDRKGRTRATLEGVCTYLDVKLVRCFPQSIPDRFWALAYQDNRVIGVIAEPQKLANDSLDTALDCLERQYFVPKITAVKSLKEEFGAVYFEVETDRGPRSFVTKAVREAQEETEEGEIFLSDVNENRYSIPDWQALDPRSRRYLERII